MHKWSSQKYKIAFAISATHDAYVVFSPKDLVRDILLSDSLNDVPNAPTDPGFYTGVLRMEYVPGSSEDIALSFETFSKVDVVV